MSTPQEILINPRTGELEEIAFLDDFILILGWLSTQKEILDIHLIDSKNRCIASLEEGGRVTRDDLMKDHLVNDLDRKSGFVYLLRKKRDVRTGALAPGFTLVFKDADKERILKSNKACLHIQRDRNKILDSLLKNWSFDLDVMNQKEAGLYQSIAHKIISPQSCDIEIRTIGQQVSNPIGTLIIPIYRRFDFINFQLCKFSTLGGLQDFQIIYVIDDPSIKMEANNVASNASDIYDIPVELIFLEKNVGFAQANNIGVEYARSENIILMNSDVLPTSGTWACELVDHLESIPDAGLIAPRLTFYDDTLQHNGMDNFTHPFFKNFSLMYHPKKGIHERFDPRTEPFQSPLLTGACLTIKKKLFEEIGGFDTNYLIGDFEDGDLSQKVNHQGFKNYLIPTIKLIHLERQSQGLFANGFREKISMLNAITYNKKWLIHG